jgi:Fe-S cluster assembly scaffold protein SufB
VSEIKNITLSDGATVRVAAGKYRAEPLLVESGSRSARIVLEAGAELHLAAFVLATEGDETTGVEAKLSLTVDLAGEGAEFDLHALYIASGGGAAGADIDVRVNHLAPGCVSRQLVKGIAADTATGSFAGMVHVAPGAQNTDASQRNQNLQLSDKAHVFTRPQLEIYADDVKCSHGATIGQLDGEAIYYMRQRGVSEAEARRMQIHGFAAEIINHCPSETLRDYIFARTGELTDRF